jgi:acetyltransferase-like isoleucine patch superfamily enzyme
MKLFRKALGFAALLAPPPINKYLYKASGVRFQDLGSLWLGAQTHLDNEHPELLKIGTGVTISFGVKIFAHFDPPALMAAQYRPYRTSEVVIGDNVFIGAGAIILPGVTVGDFALVGAGAVVTRHVDAFSIVAGNPARLIGDVRSRTN